MRKITSLIAVLLSNALLVATVNADDKEQVYDRVHFSATASAQVDNDTMIATLYAESEGQESSTLSSEVNTKIRWGLELAKKHKAVKTQTSAYTTQPVYRDKKIWGWRVRQTIRLESQDLVLMSDLLGELQQQLALQGMDFSVSPERKNKIDDQLISEALISFENRARLVTSQLRRKDYRIVDINIATSGFPIQHQQYAMRAMAMEAESSPAVSAGEQTLQVTVSGQIELE